jgi:hypothetical protein
MNINDHTEEELKAELAKREKEKSKPKPIENIDFSNIKNMAIEEIDHIIKHGENSKDIQQYMYEAVMNTVYGQDIFKFINKNC